MGGAVAALRGHWPEYLMEAAGLGLFVVSAGLLTVALEHPGSPVRQAIADPLLRRALMGAAMGLTAALIIYSPWGRQSGAHLNPAMTLTWLRLGKVKPWDAVFYVGAQFAGGLMGVLLVAGLVGPAFTAPPVETIVTRPGADGPVAAFAVEAAMAFGLMLVVLFAGNSRLMRMTGVFAAMLIAVYLTASAPVSGFSLNPARTVASALPSGVWTHAWLYFLAPPLGMLLAVEAYRLLRRSAPAACAKLDHAPDRRCIHCGYEPPAREVLHVRPV